MKILKSFFPVSLAMACATVSVAPPTVPDALKPPDTEIVALRVFASGTQNYGRKEASPGAGFAWTLVAPEATLYSGTDASSSAIGTHSAGPTWSGADGTSFVGDSSKVAKADAPDPTSIPWLLVPKKSAAPTGDFAAFTFVQRVNTVGGKAPTSGCDASAATQVIKVPYTANYYFYKSK
jgi:hypothetical protein